MERDISLHEVEVFMRPFGKYFSRSEGRALASRYVLGLILEGDRKSVEPMALRVEASERSLQRLLTEVKWDTEGVWREYRRRIMTAHAGTNGLLVVGETLFPKRGGHSVCVARQYSADPGRMVNCQMATDSIYVWGNAAMPWGIDLYVPKFWSRSGDKMHRLRRRNAGIPDHVRHRERWMLGLEQIGQAKGQGLAIGSVVSGAAFGSVSGFRDQLDEEGIPYVVEVSPDTAVFPAEPVFVEEASKRRGRERSRKHHRRFSVDQMPVAVSHVRDAVGAGPPGETEPYFFTPRQVWPAQGYREGIRHKPAWLVVSPPGISAGEGGYRYFLVTLTDGAALGGLERIGRAWEQAMICKRFMIEHLGLLHHEGRSWIGWHRHVLLVFLAWSFLLERELVC
ncbi:MAG TPA: IS701 family transposase [Syntrophales bacterium]|nr:IS701 family transposase [Syntrophales bacterium]